MLAFVDTAVTKPEIVAQLEAHAAADEIIQGTYWEKGRGCAVGCTIHSDDHAEYEPRFGIPQMLARLEDRIFEGLNNGEAKQWPLRFMGAVKPGSDLSLVGWQFLHWLLTDKTVNPGIEHPSVRDAVKQCADILAQIANGEPPAASAMDAKIAVFDAAQAASVDSARSACWAAHAAVAAVLARAESAAALSAAFTASFAEEGAASFAGENAALPAAHLLMADRLIELIEAAPMGGAHVS